MKLRASGDGSDIDEAEVRRSLSLLADPKYGFEVCSLPSGRAIVRPGGDLDELVMAVKGLPGGKGIYFRINPVPVAMGDRCAKVDDIIARRWLMIDCDPIKPDGMGDENGTDEEHEAALQLAQDVKHWLREEHGWPAPIEVDSGNGGHLLYRIDLPKDAVSQALLRSLLHSLSDRFSNDKAGVDKATHNATRLSKLPGTWARKGAATTERPHRMCRMIAVPSALVVVTVEQIKDATGEKEHPAVEPRQESNSTPPSSAKLRVTSDPAKAWAKAAFDGELGRLASSGDGDRNNTLNNAAFALGQIIGGGNLARPEVEAALQRVGEQIGLTPEECRATIRSGVEAGVMEPRKPPERATTQTAQNNGKAKTKPSPQDQTASKIKPGETIIYRASTVVPKQVEWLWHGRIPLGKLTTFAGVGGLGKTFVLCDLTARVTTGGIFPDGAAGECCEVGKVLFISGEDDPEDTIVPRLIEMGADLEKVIFLKTEVQDRFTLADLDTLSIALHQAGGGVRLVAIDPPTAYLGGTDDHKNAELRQLLSPLKSWAQEHRLALIFNTHVNKAAGKVEAMMRVMGSVAWVNAVRAAHMFARDPEDHERRLFVPMKNNLGKERKGLAYKLASTDTLAKVEWLGEVDTTADDAVNNTVKTVKRGAIASAWLIEKFREKLEWESDDLTKAAREEGISRNALFDAKAALSLPKARKVTSCQGDSTWVWWVPEDWVGFAPKRGESKPNSEKEF